MCGQHFLGTELRYYQPIPYLAHMAAVAPGMRVATGIILLSMLNPVQVAEDFATLDVVTGGRATFGTAVGYSPREFQAFGVERSERGRRFEEGLELIKKLWSGDEVEHAGTYFQLEGTVRPSVLPSQKPRPPIWIGGQSAPAVKRAARLGDAWYAPPFPTHDALRDWWSCSARSGRAPACRPRRSCRCGASCSLPTRRRKRGVGRHSAARRATGRT